jgi:hypothetical protein
MWDATGRQVCAATVALVLTIIPTATPRYSGGTGTANDPYRIATAADLIALGENPDDYNKHFILTSDIDLDPNLPGRKVIAKAVIAPDTDPARAGHQGLDFVGSFDGNGHTIKNLKVEGRLCSGFFGVIAASVSNLRLEAIEVSGTRCVGGLAAGSLGSVVNCSSSGSVDGGECVGGLVGCNNRGSIIASYSSGSVKGSSQPVGGLVGWSDGNIVASYSSGSVKGSSQYVGRLVGHNDGSIVTSYSCASVKGSSSSVAGLVGKNDGIVVASFCNTDSSGLMTGDGGTGKTRAEMQNMETFRRAGWDFAGEVANGTCDYWEITTGDYPRLHYQGDSRPVMPQGRGTAEQPYLIRDARDLGTVWLAPSAYYRLAQPIDLSGITWSTAVIPWFGGSFDGNGCTIRNLKVTGGRFLGLFGHLISSAKVSHLGLEAVEVRGTGPIGGVAGRNEGTIAASYSSGSVSSAAPIGSSAGHNSDSILVASYGSADTRRDVEVGGLVGENTGLINNSYSSSPVSCTGYKSVPHVGGLVGRNWGLITNTYSRGSVHGTGSYHVGGLLGDNVAGRITSSFWDTQTSGQTTSAGGSGRTTTEMQTAGTYLEHGWDFVGETINGAEDIWWMDEGKDYPRLWWEAATE